MLIFLDVLSLSMFTSVLFWQSVMIAVCAQFLALSSEFRIPEAQ